MVEEIFKALRSERFMLSNEIAVQDSIEQLLKRQGIDYAREHFFDETSKIDFLCGDVGVEVKIKGNKREIFRQVSRYAAFDQVKQLILVTSKNMGMPATVNNKPIFVLNISRAWL